MNMRWIGRTTGGSSIKVPLDAPSNVAAEIDDGQVSLTWKDPPDKYAANEGAGAAGDAVLVSQWAYTRVVRKQGSAPESVNDGVLICESSVRDQYSTSPFVDSQVENDILYYYGLYAFTTTGIVSEGAIISATPHAGTALSALAEGTLIKILENGAPVEFYLAKHNYESGLNGAGRELMVRKSSRGSIYWNVYPGGSDRPDYSESNLDNWLSTDYIALLSDSLLSLIGTTKFLYSPGRKWGDLGTLQRAVFSVAGSELTRGFVSDMNDEGALLPIASTLLQAHDFWTRSPTLEGAHNNWGVTDDGTVKKLPYSRQNGARPCFTLPSIARVDANLNLIVEES